MDSRSIANRHKAIKNTTTVSVDDIWGWKASTAYLIKKRLRIISCLVTTGWPLKSIADTGPLIATTKYKQSIFYWKGYRTSYWIIVVLLKPCHFLLVLFNKLCLSWVFCMIWEIVKNSPRTNRNKSWINKSRLSLMKDAR